MHHILIEKIKGKNPFETPVKPLKHYFINGKIELFDCIIDPVEEVFFF